MKKSNSSSKPLDRLSELPDSLIFHIFWFLPMREVVRTTLFSNRWKNLWNTAPYLNFGDFGVDNDTDGVGKFINRALMMWRGIKILKFKIGFTLLDKSLYTDIDLWVRFAKDKEVEELHVDLKYMMRYSVGAPKDMYWAPQCLYSCSSLKRLYLKGCNLHIPINNVVNWNQLKVLEFRCYWVSEDTINQVLWGSPQLEFLSLAFTGNHEKLTIQSRSLRYLIIEKYLYYVNYNPSVDTELRISTPNLVGLGINGVPYSKCLMNNAPRLTLVSLFFYGQTHNYRHHLFSGNDFVGETLGQILPNIQHVEQLRLSNRCIKALGALKNKNMLSPFPNVEELYLNGCFEEYEQIVHLLEIFPKLESLFLQNEKAYKQFHSKESLNFEANLPNPFLQQLRRIRVTWTEGEDSIFPFLEILLKYASKLEKMVFRVEGIASPSESLLLQWASEKVTRMPRSSPTAALIFL